MSRKFDPKEYQGKERIYRAVPGTTMISRLLIWNAARGEYCSPERGKIFDARRREKSEEGGWRVRKAYFETLEEARAWQSHLVSIPEEVAVTFGVKTEEAAGAKDVVDSKVVLETQDAVSVVSAVNAPSVPIASIASIAPIALHVPKGPTFADVVAEFKEKGYPLRSRGTCLQYDKLLHLHFQSLMSIPVNEITPKVIDNWIWTLKSAVKKSVARSQRKSFEKELDLLQVILRHYEKYNDDNDFRFPIKQRHRDDMWVVRKEGHKDRDLPREQFNLVREELRKRRGDMWWALFTVQWSAALRISEAAALHWEDVSLNWREPAKSYITVQRHAEWPRVRGVASRITPGFKNSKSLGGKKVIPLFPEAFEALKTLFQLGAKGLVFSGPFGELLEYRQVQFRYREAFQGVGIEYLGTHALRHGGCRDLYNETGGDLATAGHLLGNEDSDTVKTYAKRDRTALFKVNEKRWAQVVPLLEKVGQ